MIFFYFSCLNKFINKYIELFKLKGLSKKMLRHINVYPYCELLLDIFKIIMKLDGSKEYFTFLNDLNIVPILIDFLENTNDINV